MISRAALCILWMGGPAFAADPAGTPVPGPDCSECSHLEAPADLGHSVVIAGTSEPGERLVLEGRVLQPDGRTPAPGVLLYAYHTNARDIILPD